MKQKNTYRKRQNRFKLSSKSLLLLVAAVIILGAAIYGAYRLTKNHQNPTATNPNTASDQSAINYGPATEQERQDTEAHKNDIAQKPGDETTPGNTGTKKAVIPVVTNADKDGASAYVPGIFEEGGTCTATFTSKSGDEIQATSLGFQNSNYTSCAPIKLNGSLNIQGDWTVVVSYSSSAAEGSSQPYAFKVP